VIGVKRPQPGGRGAGDAADLRVQGSLEVTGQVGTVGQHRQARGFPVAIRA
jgi:hypothetical protein